MAHSLSPIVHSKSNRRFSNQHSSFLPHPPPPPRLPHSTPSILSPSTMQSDAQDHSMHFYDSLAIPLLRSRPHIPSSYPPATISHLVKAPDAQLAADHLHDITITDPTTIPLVVVAIRKHLLPSRARLRPPSTHHAPYLLHRLVLTVPYFYRYIATPPFFRALYRLATYPTATHAVRMLIAGWARDLRRMSPQHDPAARFWIMASRRVARKMPLPTPAHHQRFVCPIPVDNYSFPSAAKMAPGDVTASLKLLEELVAAKRRKDGSKQSVKSTDTPKRRKASKTSAIDSIGKEGREERAQNPRYARLNAKVLSVLRRHEDLMGRGDPYYMSPPTLGDHCGWSPVYDESSGLLPRMAFSSRSRSTMGSRVSVAKLARENARRKLSESQASLSMSYSGWEGEFWSAKGGEWLFDHELEFGCMQGGAESWSGKNFEGKSFACAFTPSTFAQLEVGSDGESVLAKVSEREMELAIESVGDTVKLPELEAFGVKEDLVTRSGETRSVSIGKRILRFMTSGVGARTKGEDEENGSPVGSSSCRLLPRRKDGGC